MREALFFYLRQIFRRHTSTSSVLDIGPAISDYDGSAFLLNARLGRRFIYLAE